MLACCLAAYSPGLQLQISLGCYDRASVAASAGQRSSCHYHSSYRAVVSRAMEKGEPRQMSTPAFGKNTRRASPTKVLGLWPKAEGGRLFSFARGDAMEQTGWPPFRVVV